MKTPFISRMGMAYRRVLYLLTGVLPVVTGALADAQNKGIPINWPMTLLLSIGAGAVVLRAFEDQSGSIHKSGAGPADASDCVSETDIETTDLENAG